MDTTRSNPAEIIDAWLEAHKKHTNPGDVICHTKQVTVYFPVEDPRAPEYADKIQELMARIFGGATIWDAQGVWCEEAGCMLERCRVIQSAHSCAKIEDLEKFASLLKEAMAETKQSYLGIRGTTAFYAIPSGAIITGPR